MKVKGLSLVILCGLVLMLANCGSRSGDELYTVGVFQINSNPNLDAAREGFIGGLKQAGYEDGKNIHLIVKNAQGDIATAQLIAQQFTEEADMIMAISTPCLQAAIKATSEKPIIFGEIANAYVAGAGTSATDHLPNVTGAFSFHPMLDSTSKCNCWPIEEYLIRCLEVKALSRSIVELVHHELDLLGRDRAKVGALGEVLPN